MEFCENCDFLITNIIKDTQLIKMCNNCGLETECTSTTISNKNYGRLRNLDDNNSYIKKYRIYDSRLQRTIHEICGNINCSTHSTPSTRETVTYNETIGLERVYVCSICLTEWRYT
jgi:hypothetical protein